MVDVTPPAAGERQLKLRYPARCRLCSTQLSPGTVALWDGANKSARCLTCMIPSQPNVEPIAVSVLPDYGTAGGSAQRMYDRREAKRRANLRSKRWLITLAAVVGAAVGGWVGAKTNSNVVLYAAIGAFLPVARLLQRPQHIAAWRTGAAGEQQVGRMLDGAGRAGLRVAGRRQDKMITGVQSQVSVVRDVLAGHGVDPAQVRGLLCFTKADLPLFRPSPGGIQLHYPRGLRKQLRRPGPLSQQQVKAIADLLAQRLPPA